MKKGSGESQYFRTCINFIFQYKSQNTIKTINLYETLFLRQSKKSYFFA